MCKKNSFTFFFLASFKFNPLTKTEIPGVEKVSLTIKVNDAIYFFFQASERAGILNPRIWLAKHSHVTGPAFYDTAHGSDFFPAVAIKAAR